jgi:hypothetical protein
LSGPAREDHTPTFEDIFSAEDAEGYRIQSTAEAGEGWEEERCRYHASVGEIHSLARASHALVCRCLERLRLVSTDAKDNGEHDGEAHVMWNLVEERKSSFEKIRPEILSKFGGRDGGDERWLIRAMLIIKEADKVLPNRRIKLEKTLVG